MIPFVVVLIRISSEDWTAAEELNLVDQVRKLGLGAWEDIAESVRSCFLSLHEEGGGRVLVEDG